VDRILLISHEPEAAPALIGRILTERGYPVDHHVVLTDPTSPDTDYPDPRGYAAVIAFGSFANAYDEGARAWVEPEVSLIGDLVRDDVPYLGVCFGGQLLAETLGGHVERAPADQQEIGLVTFDEDPDLPIPAGPWFTWHEDRVVLPDGVPVLAHNGRAVQLFRHGRAVGTQFHPEADIEVVGSWVRIGPDHIPDHTSGEVLLADLDSNADRLRENCERLVDWFLHEVAGLDRRTA
jgi:GMP synthase-like glutamine amidotransferase